jgi:hypothetical protein
MERGWRLIAPARGPGDAGTASRGASRHQGRSRLGVERSGGKVSRLCRSRAPSRRIPLPSRWPCRSSVVRDGQGHFSASVFHARRVRAPTPNAPKTGSPGQRHPPPSAASRRIGSSRKLSPVAVPHAGYRTALSQGRTDVRPQAQGLCGDGRRGVAACRSSLQARTAGKTEARASCAFAFERSSRTEDEPAAFDADAERGAASAGCGGLVGGGPQGRRLAPRSSSPGSRIRHEVADRPWPPFSIRKDAAARATGGCRPGPPRPERVSGAGPAKAGEGPPMPGPLVRAMRLPRARCGADKFTTCIRAQAAPSAPACQGGTDRGHGSRKRSRGEEGELPASVGVLLTRKRAGSVPRSRRIHPPARRASTHLAGRAGWPRRLGELAGRFPVVRTARRPLGNRHVPTAPVVCAAAPAGGQRRTVRGPVQSRSHPNLGDRQTTASPFALSRRRAGADMRASQRLRQARPERFSQSANRLSSVSESTVLNGSTPGRAAGHAVFAGAGRASRKPSPGLPQLFSRHRAGALWPTPAA